MPLWEHLETHIPGIYRFALRLTANSDWAEDLTQETLLRAWQKRRQLRDTASARVWLFRIAVNLWRDQIRQNKHRPVMESGIDTILDQRLGPDDKLVQHEELRRVLKAIEQLPPRQREVLYLFAVEEFRVAEIADVLGISANAVKVHLCEARKKMRDAFPLENPSIPTSRPE